MVRLRFAGSPAEADGRAGTDADGGRGPHDEGGRSAPGPSNARRFVAACPSCAVSPDGSQYSFPARLPANGGNPASGGRSSGCFSRQWSTSVRRSPVSRPSSGPRLGASFSTRWSTVGVGAPSHAKGENPFTAYASTAPSANTSAAPVSSSPLICSGGMYPGEPSAPPVCVTTLASTERAIPKSMTFGPSSVTMTFDGFRSRWISPLPWIASSALARPYARAHTDCSGSGPCRVPTTSRSVDPATYPVATQGTADSMSWSSTGAVHVPRTRRAASTSARNRRRKWGSRASSPWTTLTATIRPLGERPRNTRPMPPSPSRPSNR